MKNKTTHFVRLFTIVLLLQTISMRMMAQQPDNTSNPSILQGNASSEIRESEISLEKYNEAMQHAGLAKLRNTDPRVVNGKIKLYYEVPLIQSLTPEQQQSRLNTRRVNVPFEPENILTTQRTSSPATVAVAPSTEFAGVNYNNNSTHNGGYVYIPPDTHGAAGSNHVGYVVNCMIDFKTKTGAAVSGYPKGLSTFFTSLSPATATFDPKILWDQYENRWVVITLERVASPTASKLFIAVSANSDPTGTWYFQSLDVKLTIAGDESWFDYPGFAVDEEAIYLTGNYFRFTDDAYKAGRLFILNKGTSGGLYGGGTSTATAYDYITLAGAGSQITHQPAHTFGTVPGTTGTWLVAYSGLSGGGNEFLQFVRVDNPLTSPTFTQGYIALGNIDTGGTMNDAPQSGTSNLVETNDKRTLNAVWRNNSLWLATTIVSNSAANNGQPTAYWARLNTSNAALPVLAQNEIGGEDIGAGTYTFFPAIAVNDEENAIVAFSASNSSMFPSFYAIGINSSNTMGGSDLVEVGVDYYYRTFGGSRNRWGDYSGAAIDPVDNSFWLFNEIALARGNASGSEDGRWGTHIAQYGELNPFPVELINFKGKAVENDIVLTWETASELNNAGFDIQEMIDGRYQSIGYVAGHGNSSSLKNYRFVVKDKSPGKYFFRLNQQNYDGKNALSASINVSLRINRQFHISKVAPNPIYTKANFTLGTAQNQAVSIMLYSLDGQLVKNIWNGQLTAQDQQEITIEAQDIHAGVYLVRIIGETFNHTEKVTFIK